MPDTITDRLFVPRRPIVIAAISVICMAHPMAAQSDAEFYLAGKERGYFQSGPTNNDVTLGNENPYAAFFNVFDFNASTVNAATSTLTSTMGFNEFFDVENESLFLEGDFMTLGELDGDFPNDDYTFNIDLVSGTDITATLTLAGR
jgi:hypothetical protein